MPSDFAMQLLTTNLWIYLVGGFFAFFLVGVFWATLFEHYFSGFGGDLISFAGASLSLIVGSIYSAFLGKMMNDYLSGPRSYTKLLVQIGNAGDAIAGLHRGVGSDGEAFANIKSMLQHLGFYAFRVFAPENRDRLGLEESRPIVTLQGANLSSMSEVAAENPTVYAVENVPADLATLVRHAHWEDPMRTVHDLRIYLYEELARMKPGALDPEIVRMALRSLKPVWAQLEEIESNRLLREPAVFKVHMQGIFVFYFFVWVPISSWAAVGWFWTAIAYPVVAMVFLGFGIYNLWIGDAFDPRRPVLVADLLGARETYAVTEMERKFAALSTTKSK